MSKHKTGNAGSVKGRKLNFKTLIKPSKIAVKAHTKKIKRVITKHKHSPQESLIKELNPIIRGWSNYYSGVASKEIFSKIDHIMWTQLRAWVVTRCGKASYKKLSNYFRPGTVKIENGKERKENWLFQAMNGMTLRQHNWKEITRHTSVRPEASEYDGNWKYWATRKGKSLEIPQRVANLLKMQKGQCKHCGQYFTNSDLLEVDHIIPTSQGGKDEYKNMQVLHRHCHDNKTALDNLKYNNSKVSSTAPNDNGVTELGAV